MRADILQKASAVSLLSYLLLFSIVIASDEDFLQQESCFSSCGELEDIRYPFRLKNGPANCSSDALYELVCIGNKTVLEQQSGKYYVTTISYISSTIQIVDAALANGECNLPSQSISPRSVNYFGYSYLVSRGWASFIKCSKEIKHHTYRPVPCLTQNGTFVYVSSGIEVMNLAPSCGFLSMIPMISDTEITSQTDVFKLLRKGFVLSWIGNSLSTSKIIRTCLGDSSRMFSDLIGSNKILSQISSLVKSEMHFLACLEDYSTLGKHYVFVFHIAIAIMVVVEIAKLLIVLAILGRFVIAPLTILAFLAHTLRSMLASIDVVEKFLKKQETLSPKRYAYSDIIAMTKHFKEKLGQGGFGSVFKGTLPGTGGRLVAVKMLGNSKCNGDEFINEVSTIGRTHHLNVVQLIGYCSDGSNRALIYEYMPNGSLDKYIFSSNRTTYRPFSLEKLNEIALGVAHGIDYLHRGCNMRILHFDIKPHNILLDHNFNPKVSDFGLAKLYPKDSSVVSVSAARGTIGYIAPELISRNFGVISNKSDVYSYGMLLMEMAGGRRNVDPKASHSSEAYYPSWIYDRLVVVDQKEEIKIDDTFEIEEVVVVDQKEEIKIDDTFEIEEVERKLCIVGLWCIQIRPTDRPSIGEVIEMLEGNVDDLQMAPKPFFSSPEPSSAHDSFSTALSSISSDC